MNAINTTKTLLVNVNDDYPLFKVVSCEETILLRQSGDWAGYWFKLMKYSVEGTTLTIYHIKPTMEKVSLYFTQSHEVIEKMAECQSLLAPARMLAEYFGLENGVYFTTRNFDDPTNRPRSVGIFSPLLNEAEVEGYDKTVIDLNEVDPDELSGYFEGRRYPQGANFHNFEGRRYPQRINLPSFFAAERDHIVSFIRQIRRKVMS